ncbi:MAG: polymerase, partial [Verrucomicrobiota bacterium]|nr:polymerase [Verrucomicrobiota bacterium]
MTVYLDTETFSATPIRDGTYKYAADCEVDIISYAVDDRGAEVLDVTENPAHAREFVLWM